MLFQSNAVSCKIAFRYHTVIIKYVTWLEKNSTPAILKKREEEKKKPFPFLKCSAFVVVSPAVNTSLPGWKIIRKTGFCQHQWPQEPHYITRMTPERTQNLNIILWIRLYRVFFSQSTHICFSQVYQQVRLYSCTQLEWRNDHEKLGSFYQTFCGKEVKGGWAGERICPRFTPCVPFSSLVCVILSPGVGNWGLWEERWKEGWRWTLWKLFSWDNYRSCGHILIPSLWKKAYNAFIVFLLLD